MRRGGALALIAAGAAWAGAASAQTPEIPQVISPLRVETDHNNVNLVNGRTTMEPPALSVPAAPNLRFDRVQNAAPFVVGRIAQGEFGETRRESYSVHTGGAASESFQCVDYDCETVTGTGSTFRPNSLVYRQAGSGARWQFNLQHFKTEPRPGQDGRLQYYAQAVSYPNGETISYSYDQATLPGDESGRLFYRPNRIESSLGYFITVTYQPGALGTMGWSTPATATLFAAAAPDIALRRLSYSGDTIRDSGDTVDDDSDDRVFTCSGCVNALGNDLEIAAGMLQLPGETAPATQAAAHASVPVVQSVTQDGVTWTYSYANLRFSNPLFLGLSPAWLYDSVTVTGPNGFRQVHAMRPAQNRNVLDSVTDSLDRRTAFQFDAAFRPTRITYPEGNAVSIAYDQHGNIVARTQHARPNTLPDITEYADYPTNYLASACPVACWRPLGHRDALGRATDYRYNSRGQLERQLDPADANGIRRLSLVGYALSEHGISRRERVEVCGVSAATAIEQASCGTAPARRTEFAYQGDTLLVTRERQVDPATGAGLETRHSYDAQGRLVSTDGPLPGDADTVHYRYDAFGRRIWEIGPADANGLRQATRSFYRAADDKVERVETGTVTTVTPIVFATPLGRTETRYDARRNPIRETVSGYDPATRAWTIEAVLQRAFDERGQPVCEARRMNRALFAAPPADPCVPGPEGTEGPDRITRNVYDAAGQRLQHRVGVGYPAIEAAEATWEYNGNGQITAVIDGNGNRAELRYDHHLRQDRWTFPSPNGPPGTVNANDYEEYGYDAAGNRTSLRRRDGSTLSFHYDALDRLVRKTVPERAGLSATHTRDVFYGYDLRDLQLYARFDSHSGEGVTNAYDAFGRLSSSSINLGGTTRTLAYTWDAAGNRRELRHPDGQMFETNYDPALSRPVSIGENGATWGPGMLAAFGYDAFARPLYLARGNGATTYFAADALRRRTAIGHDLQGGSVNDLALQFAYNPASGLRTATRSNDAYAWTGHYQVDRAYQTNGLNQYTQAGTAGFAYDLNGNLRTSPGPIASETLTYTYDVENRLVQRTSTGASSTVTLTYDPLGRLFSLAANGATTTFLYDGDALVAEYNGPTLLRRFVHGPATGADDPLVWYEGPTLTDRRWLHADERGSIVAVTNGAGTNLAINRYDEYGIPAPTNQGRFQYTGQIWLPELGLYYYKARIYSPTIGRFFQTDPIGYDDQFNLYAYVRNDPVNAVDPTGMQQGELQFGYFDVSNRATNNDEDPFLAAFTVNRMIVTGVSAFIPVAEAPAAITVIGSARVGLLTRAWRGLKSLFSRRGARRPSTLRPGRQARDSVPATGSRSTTAQQQQINRIGDENGCHTCGSPTSGHSDGHWTGDHQPPNALNPPGGQQRLYPQCDTCRRRQAGEVTQEVMRRRREAER